MFTCAIMYCLTTQLDTNTSCVEQSQKYISQLNNIDTTIVSKKKKWKKKELDELSNCYQTQRVSWLLSWYYWLYPCAYHYDNSFIMQWGYTHGGSITHLDAPCTRKRLDVHGHSNTTITSFDNIVFISA